MRKNLDLRLYIAYLIMINTIIYKNSFYPSLNEMEVGVKLIRFIHPGLCMNE